MQDMCEHYGIKLSTFQSRINKKWSLEKALTTSLYECCDHLGNKFKSEKEMARYYKISAATYYKRIETNWKLEEALGVSGRGLDASIRNKEVLNTKIGNIKFAYTGLDSKVYYECIDKETGEELLLNADEILIYKQKDYKTAVEQLIQRRRNSLNGKS